MRIVFADPDHTADVVALAKLDAKIEGWWASFVQNADKIDGLFKQRNEFDLVGWMHEFLGGIDERIMWEFGPAVVGAKHRLVITPEGDRQLRPIVDRLLASAPQDTGFEFYGARLPEGLEMARQTVKGRTGVAIDDAVATLSVDDRNLLELHLYGDLANDEEAAFGAAVITCETMLGEAFMERWVGAVEVSPMPTAGLLRKQPTTPAGAIALADLRAQAERAVKGIQRKLPDAPCYALVDDWTFSVYRLEPPEGDELPEQLDLMVATVGHQAVFEAAHSSRDFDSERFSRNGETFCYLKVDGAEGLEGSAYADRGDIADALEAALKPARLGVNIGGGTGRRYSYVDLALTEREAGIAKVVQTLREGKIPKRSWIQFFDADLRDEWVGVYPDTPSPPGLDDEVGELPN